MKHLKRNTITNERLHELLNYDPETGVFTRKVRTANCIHIGDVAGYKRPSGYISIWIDGRSHLAHRLAWQYAYGYDTEWEIDHINRIRHDNRIANLREASHSCNAHNSSMRADNTSGVPGVCWNKQKGKWQAEAKINGKHHHLGLHDDLIAAAKARLAHERAHPDVYSCDATKKTEQAFRMIVVQDCLSKTG
jgi:hypothetical protein